MTDGTTNELSARVALDNALACMSSGDLIKVSFLSETKAKPAPKDTRKRRKIAIALRQLIGQELYQRELANHLGRYGEDKLREPFMLEVDFKHPIETATQAKELLDYLVEALSMRVTPPWKDR